MKLKIIMYQVDAFTSHLFHGNPAGVCLLEYWLPDRIMQEIASENNLAETAFVIPKGNDYKIRWFTPLVEVDLCGHATLASAHILFEKYSDTKLLKFFSPRSGLLTVEKNDDLYTLDFPEDHIENANSQEDWLKAFHIPPLEIYKGKTDYLLLYQSQDDIVNLEPDFNLLLKAKVRGVMITAAGRNTDFVSRFFAPAVGINEDPVTGSAHTTLSPFWSRKLGKNRLTARQLSKRGGELTCEHIGDRVKISGMAVTYLSGEINLDLAIQEN